MKKIAILLSIALTTAIHAQTSIIAIDDTSSADKLITAMYQVISGPAGPRNWARFKNLFTPGADMGAVYKNQQGVSVYTSFSPDDYIKNNDPYFLKNAFTEKEIHRTICPYGQLVNVFSTYQYESGAEKARGINSLQLVYSKNRWWIASLIWLEETEDNPVPANFLPN